MRILGLLRLEFSISCYFNFNVYAWTKCNILNCAFRLEAALIVLDLQIYDTYPIQSLKACTVLWLKQWASSYGNKINSCTEK